ncbi:protein Niban 1 [Petaurus breviceps papuanus]|uniref:protein Niban 1 n=1 Tax=Petaurus breviceps papuanus TaxID=3040969 RepID=UPI0036D9692C
MGGSASSQLDESKCTYIQGKTEAAIKNFSPHYRRQYSVAFCNDVRNEVEQHRDLRSQFLKTKPPSDTETVLYEGELSHFADDLKKWKDRYIVVKNDFTVESYENKEAYQKGANPKSRILPAGGKVLTSEEDYNLLSDRHFPDPIAPSEKENFQPFVVLPKEFPVYLWQPFLRHNYFCFQDSGDQKQFSTLLNDCIRHLNHDYLKQKTFEAQAFLEAVQFFRQEKGHYGSWDMITGNEVQILSNLVMEELLPTLQTDLLPKMKGKKNDRKRAWFGILEEAYNLVQHQVSEGLSTLKEECRALTKGLEGTIRSDMDQIVNSKNFLAGKIRVMVAEPAGRTCAESIQPFLSSILEELMGPVSSGFSEVRALFEKEVNEISQSFQTNKDPAQLKEHLDKLRNLPLNSVKMEPCYLKVNLLQEQLQDLKSRFKFPHIDLVVQRTQNYMQELMENAVYTFEQLLSPHQQGDVSKIPTAIEKVKKRVLKQYDHDSSTIRKMLFQEALVQITLPTMQKALASTCKPELQKYEQFIFADHTNVIQVENVYEEILYQTLLDETVKVIKEAAVLKKHNLFEDNMALPCESVSSLTDLKTPSGSNQASPAKKSLTGLQAISDHEISSNEVFLTSEEKSPEAQPDCAYPSAREESMSFLLSGLSLNTNDKVIISRMFDQDYSSQEEKVDFLSTDTLRMELGGIVENVNQSGEKTLAPDSLSEIRNLLTVTVEVPTDPAQKEKGEAMKNDVNQQGEEGEKGEKAEETQINEEAKPTPIFHCKERAFGEISANLSFPSSLETTGTSMMQFPEVGSCGPQPACVKLSGEHREEETEPEATSVWYTEANNWQVPQSDQLLKMGPSESMSIGGTSMLQEIETAQLQAIPAGTEMESTSASFLKSMPLTEEDCILGDDHTKMESAGQSLISLEQEKENNPLA